MPRTRIDTDKTNFTINGELTYSEIENSNPDAHGLLMNARFIQGIFDDKADQARYARFGREQWDPERNTDELIAALPEWYRYGLRAFTVGIQGGGPCATIPNGRIDNNPFGEDGATLDPAYAGRLDRLIRAADETGMVVIVSYLYQGQIMRLRDGKAIRNAVATASRFLKEGGYTNVIIEVANEQTVGDFKKRPIVCSGEGMVYLMDLARTESGGMLVGCSDGGGTEIRETAEASDVVLIHGNGCSRQRYHNLIRMVREWVPGRPIVCNEDSPCVGQLTVAYTTHTSWGYYNNYTKQEPPADWGVTPGEDTFFAHRMAMGIGIEIPALAPDEQYYLQGLEPTAAWENKRWVRLASLYPERINYVEFFRDGELVDTAYDEPFIVNHRCNWLGGPVEVLPDEKQWTAVVHRADGETVEIAKPVGAAATAAK